MHEDDNNYEVGYGKPPKNGQFAKGKSGNPKGRPKGSKNLSTIVMKEMRQPVRLNGPHGSKTVTKLEASVMQVSNKSAQGDMRAFRELVNLVQRSEEDITAQRKPLNLHEVDQKTMQNLLQRMRATSTTQEIHRESEL